MYRKKFLHTFISLKVRLIKCIEEFMGTFHTSGGGGGYPLAPENRPRNIVFRRFVRIFLFFLIFFWFFFHTFISLFETNKMYVKKNQKKYNSKTNTHILMSCKDDACNNVFLFLYFFFNFFFSIHFISLDY